MPTTDDSAPPPARPSARRSLGRGPGTRSAEAPYAAAPVEHERAPERAGRERAPEPGEPVVPVDAVGPVAGPGPAASAEPDAVGEPVRPAGPGTVTDRPEAAGHGPGTIADGPRTPDRGSPAVADGPETPGDGAGAVRGGTAEDGADGAGGGFTVRLHNFEGPFDLLLQLIAKHKLDVTEVALSRVTDEFIAYIRAMGPDWDLDQATEFLVVAATLLDLKAARLLPAAEVEDEEDLALLEARDLLFARLLQYRAYKRIAAILADRWAGELLHRPRTVGLEPHHADLLPEVVISIGPEGFAGLAARAMIPKPRPTVYVEHIHAPLVSVREQAEVVVARLRELGSADFRTLTDDAPDTLTVVARFLALLELYREKAVALDQEEALGVLLVRWTGDEGHQPVVTDEFDRENVPAERKEEDAT